MSRCKVEACDQPRYARGLCNLHYQRFRKHGSVEAPRPSLEDRFFSKVEQVGDDPVTACWEWRAANCRGYGQFFVGRTEDNSNGLVYAHRWSWELFNGPLPPDMTIDHLCKNPPCVNPWHMEPVPNPVNAQRGNGWIDGGCQNGHDINDPNNVYRNPNSGLQACRPCRKAWAQGLQEKEAAFA